jgi:hypothetical protein
MIGLILEKIQDIIILKVLIVSLLGLILFIVHSFTLHNYLRNRSFIVTSMILPAVAMVITTVISKNIVLSLGMIGALSIIRYRTPVKSIYELSLLFALITIGIAGGVNIKYSIGLSVFISLIGLLTFISSKIYPNIFLKDYSYDQKHIEVNLIIDENFNSLSNLKGLSKFLISYEEDNLNKRTNLYLKFNTIKEADSLKKELAELNGVTILNYNLTYR